MKKRYLLLIIFGMLTIASQAQIQKGGCREFKNYHKMQADRSNLKKKVFEDPIKVYGKSDADAKYKAKIEVLRQLTGNTQYLDNPRVDSVLAEFAGEIVFLVKDEYEVVKTRPRKDRIAFGARTCFVYETKYNPELIEYLQYYINNFIKYSITFIINPYIETQADVSTLGIYKKALGKFHTKCLEPKYKFDNVIEGRMLNRTKLQNPPADYNPAKEFRVYKTGNKYLDYVSSITNNENRSRQVDIIFSLDTISFTNPEPSKYFVTFHLIGYNTHTASEILVYDSELEVEATSEYYAVEKAIEIVFDRDIDNYMYDISKRYSSYVRDGMLFTLKISDSLIPDEMVAMKLENAMLDCKLFAEASINGTSWRQKGKTIGRSYEGRSYLLDRMRFKLVIYDLLTNVGIKNFKIDLSGTDFIVTPKKVINN